MKVAVIGLGQRGSNYIRIINFFCKGIEIVADCDKNKVITDQIAKKYKVAKKFYDDKDFFKEKLADAIIVATQDRDHITHCNLAIDKGYDKILVEKPVSPVIEECVELQQRAEKNNITIVVCHVLRYSKYYKKIKEIISKGIIGDVMTINHTENVGYFHYAHSYVRGNWRDSSLSSPMIMAKCCHDFDLLHWFVNKKCLSVSSYGALSHFNKKNMPEGAADRCVDCKVENCPFNAVELYVTDPLCKATFLRFSGRILTGKSGSSKEEKLEALKKGNYGRCVYKQDNNVVDHQIVNMLFENGTTASHTVTAFSKDFYRRTQVSGTKGEIIGNDLDGKLTLNIFKGKSKTIGTKWIKGLGHIDGDINLIKDWCKLIQGKLDDDSNVTYLRDTIPSHIIVMSAEKSRLESGKVIKID